MDNNIYNVREVLNKGFERLDSKEDKEEAIEWKMPKGKKAVDFVISMSENMRPEVHQKYLTLGVVCAAFSSVDIETIISTLKEAGKWED